MTAAAPSLTMKHTAELDLMVRQVLAHPEGHPWTLMGFGMLRCDLGGRDYRLNIWDRRYRTIDVASIHDHPWDLESLILSGPITNVLYEDRDRFELSTNPHYCTHYRNTIQPGSDGVELDPPKLTELAEVSRTSYGPGEGYAQGGKEIHDSLYLTGTVTLIRRTNRATEARSGDRARIYWPKAAGATWVDAIPQEATAEKVRAICDVALAMWGEHVQAAAS